MLINRVWAMPNKWTFRIKPIKKLLEKYVSNGKGWVDPFSGMSNLVEFTNDLNPNTPTKSHLEALEFLKQFKDNSMEGVLFDPPYSIPTLLRCYEEIGVSLKGSKKIKTKWGENNNFWKDRKIQAGRIIKPNGIAISFGWSTCGIGKTNGFKIVEILLVCHGGLHNDTIVTIEKKIQNSLTNDI